MVQHILGIKTEFQGLAFSDSHRLTYGGIEQPESWPFHGVQAEGTSLAREWIPENDYPFLAVGQVGEPFCGNRLPCRYRPCQRLQRAASRWRGATQSVEILQARDTGALRIRDSEERVRIEVASRPSAIIPMHRTELCWEASENGDAFRRDVRRTSTEAALEEHPLSADAVWSTGN